jgi:hypothetical protein
MILMVTGPILAWTLLAVFLVFGLIVHERTGLRLGGVLVLPLLLLYSLLDLTALAVFALAAIVALAVGHVLYRRTFLYGRRLLYVFLLAGIGATIVARAFIDTELGVFVLAILPGLFAYNLHREGNLLKGATAFAMGLGFLLVASVALLWAVFDPMAISAGMNGVAFAGMGATPIASSQLLLGFSVPVATGAAYASMLGEAAE